LIILILIPHDCREHRWTSKIPGRNVSGGDELLNFLFVSIREWSKLKEKTSCEPLNIDTFRSISTKSSISSRFQMISRFLKGIRFSLRDQSLCDILLDVYWLFHRKQNQIMRRFHLTSLFEPRRTRNETWRAVSGIFAHWIKNIRRPSGESVLIVQFNQCFRSAPGFLLRMESSWQYNIRQKWLHLKIANVWP
jgi:hypothetical protein